MSKILLWGEYMMNAGPSNVHRSLINHSNGELNYIKSQNKFIKYIELFWKLFYCDTVVYPTSIPIRDIRIFKFFNKKRIGILHGCSTYENEINKLGLDSQKIARKENTILNFSDIIVCVSKKFSLWCRQRFPQYAAKITYVNNGIAIAPRPKKEKRSNVIAISGGNRQIKNNNYVCRAVEKLNEEGFSCQIKIFGRLYPDNEDLTQYPHTNYIGHLDKCNYYEMLDEIPLYVIASEIEPFGLVVADAMNCHCSVLLSQNVGASSIMRTQEEDIIENPHDITELAEKIRFILETPNTDRLLSTIDIEACSEQQAWKNLKAICNNSPKA